MIEKLKRIWFETPQLLALALGLVVIGLAIYDAPGFIAAYIPSFGGAGIRDAAKSMAGVIVSVGLLQLILRSVIWRDAIDVALKRVELKQHIIQAGLDGVLPSDQVPYDEYFNNAKSVTVVNIAARHFFVATKASATRAFLKRGGKLLLIMTDPEADNLLLHYDECFGEPPGTRKTKCQETIRAIADFVENHKEVTENLKIRFTRRRLTYALQQFDDIRTVALYRSEPQNRDAGSIPVLVYRDGNIARSFSDPDLKFLTDKDSRSIELGALRGYAAAPTVPPVLQTKVG
ncbi:hypothetical protein [Sorangium sp. So ce1097]|uniref:hypothetical protein n=1 Tax=Sorangium sp. So ce1097 TaxID=3133330 RepID=UPI003F601927